MGWNNSWNLIEVHKVHIFWEDQNVLKNSSNFLDSKVYAFKKAKKIDEIFTVDLTFSKGQLILKQNCRGVTCPNKQKVTPWQFCFEIN